MLFKFTFTVYKSEMNLFYIISTLIYFDLVLYFFCLNGCVGGNVALGCGPGTDYP